MGMIGAFVDRQIARRAPRAAPPLILSARQLYILPTPAGGLFVIGLIVMTLGATNYGNNLAFALTFWLGGVALVSMHRTHRNMAGLRLASVHAEPVFAGEMARFELRFDRAANRVRRRIVIGAEGMPSDCHDVDESTPVICRLAARRRGQLALPVLHLESRYPLGLFRCWAQLAPRIRTLVYPEPVGDSLPPQATGDAGPSRVSRLPGEHDFIGHRRYRPGDAARNIDWKQSARSPHLLVREHARPEGRTTHRFDYDTVAHLGLEAGLSQLALWVIEAEARGAAYTLVLPGQILGPAGGPAHRRACLEALALFT